MNIKLAKFIEGYIECAVWCGLMMYKCEHDENAYECDECDPDEIDPSLESADADPGLYDESDFEESTLAEIERECRDFVASNIFDLMASTLDSSQCGHDFYLTRNRHGAGFWDHFASDDGARGAACDRLSDASKVYGEASFVLGKDGKIGAL